MNLFITSAFTSTAGELNLCNLGALTKPNFPSHRLSCGGGQVASSAQPVTECALLPAVPAN
ncbi:unnamed protein product [Protopolystoma xenopodis]|uniref:Uncharacterized protein n=1 Tax=Protopolystoma xenopodis TaxID=117903 RepID=A0A3S5BWR5_9PLAT|nr:unnamed protein product [Protopolystoma xenopodis]